MFDPRGRLPEFFLDVPEAHITIADGTERESRPTGRLIEDGRRVASGLAGEGLQPGDLVGLYATTSFDFIVGCIAVWFAGGVVVSLPPSDFFGPRQLRSTARTPLGLSLLLLGDDDPSPKEDVPRTLRIAELVGSQPADLPDVDPSKPALVQFSSGTTSAARGVVLSHRAIAAYLERIAEALDVAGKARRYVSWLPLNHDLGFIQYLLQPLAVGGSLTLIPTQRFLREPLVWLREISAVHAGATAAPSFAYGLTAKRLATKGDAGLDLSGLWIAGTGGEPVDPRVLDRFASATKQYGFDPIVFWAGYGLAEATCAVCLRQGIRVDEVSRDGVAYDKAAPASEGRYASFTSMGPPLRDTEVLVLDDRGEPLPGRRIGEVVLRSPMMMEGYLGSDINPIDEKGWLHTGDRGYLAGGELFVTGRTRDLLIIRGKNFHAEDIESVACQIDGIRPGCCVAFAVGGWEESEKLVLVVETGHAETPRANSCRMDLRRLVRAEFGLAAKAIAVVPAGTLPKTTSGKLQRSRSRSLYEEGRFDRWL